MMHTVYTRIASGTALNSPPPPPPTPLLAPVKYSGCAVDGKDAGFLKVECDCTELERFNVLQKSKLIKLLGSYPMYNRYADNTVVFFCCRAAVCVATWKQSVSVERARNQNINHTPSAIKCKLPLHRSAIRNVNHAILIHENDIKKDGGMARNVQG